MALLDVSNLRTYFYTREGIVRAVDGVSFTVNSGEALGLVGESGCGKSVTAMSLLQLVASPPGRIVEGSAIFDGRDLLKMDARTIRSVRGREISMIFQDPMTSLNPIMTIGRQISEALELHLRMDRSEARKRTVELLDLVGIPEADKRLNEFPHQFSGGMRQRVMIAMALSCNPKLVLADEISTALDVTIQAQILDLLKRLALQLGTAFIVITHDLGVIAGMTQRVHVMYAGQIVEKANTKELFASPRMPYTWGLLRGRPRLAGKTRERLTAIDGMPPDLAFPPPGCRFAPRCRYRRDICGIDSPDLLVVPDAGPDHWTRCWGMQVVEGGGWLRGMDWRRMPDPVKEA